MTKRIAVLGVQVPFIRGGAELLNDELVRQINLRAARYDVQADLIQLPFKWYPETHVLQDMLAWKLVDITESDGHTIDLVIGTKFPSYCADHPSKVLWLVHQHRAFYDLEGTSFDVPSLTDLDRATRFTVKRADSVALTSCKARFSIAETVADRLRRFNSCESTVLYPPPKLCDRIYRGDYRDYILYVGRQERIKRIELLIGALALDKSSKAVILGTGKYREYLQALAEKHALGDRCVFPGYVTDEQYLEYLAHCRAVYYGPYDEDYGFATVEAFLAEKPVMTFADSGEPAAMVRRTGAGWVAERPTADALAEITAKVTAMDGTTLQALGYAGRCFGQAINWDTVFQQLVEQHL